MISGEMGVDWFGQICLEVDENLGDNKSLEIFTFKIFFVLLFLQLLILVAINQHM